MFALTLVFIFLFLSFSLSISLSLSIFSLRLKFWSFCFFHVLTVFLHFLFFVMFFFYCVFLMFLSVSEKHTHTHTLFSTNAHTQTFLCVCVCLSLSLYLPLFLSNLNIITPSFSPIFLSIPSSVNLSNMQSNMKYLSANLPVSLSLLPSIVWCLSSSTIFLPSLLLLLLCLLGGQEGQTLQKLVLLISNALPTLFFTTQSFNNYFSHIYLVLLLLTLSNPTKVWGTQLHKGATPEEGWHFVGGGGRPTNSKQQMSGLDNLVRWI